jgi:type VI secretion system protein ImpI
MELIFEIVSYHRLSPEQVSKKSVKDSITFGRSENNDWHLPDPEKVVSGIHAKVERQADDFFIHDFSTNGLFINRAVEALGKNKVHKLMPNDLLTFGDYEVSVTFVEGDSSAEADEDMRQPSETNQFEEEFSPAEVKGINSAKLTNDLFALDTHKDEFMPVVNNSLDDYFDAPQPIPEEWDEDFFNMSSKKSTPIPDEVFDIEPETPKAVVQKVPEPIRQREVKHTAIQKAVVKQAPAQQAPVQQAPQKAAAIPKPKPAFKEPTIQSSRINRPTSSISSQFAFLEGLGVSPEIATEVMSDDLMHEMGECMQRLLLGLMESLRNRSSLKNEFRVNQTTFQQQENNPLKFSASIDDVFQNLFLRKSASFLPANKAVTEAFDDTRKHDIALTAGTLGEIEGILKQLDPEGIEDRDTTDSILDKVLPGNRQSRYWKLYKTLHADTSNQISDQGSSALSDDFVRAYDKKINSL